MDKSERGLGNMQLNKMNLALLTKMVVDFNDEISIFTSKGDKRKIPI